MIEFISDEAYLASKSLNGLCASASIADIRTPISISMVFEDSDKIFIGETSEVLNEACEFVEKHGTDGIQSFHVGARINSDGSYDFFYFKPDFNPEFNEIIIMHYERSDLDHINQMAKVMLRKVQSTINYVPD